MGRNNLPEGGIDIATHLAFLLFMHRSDSNLRSTCCFGLLALAYNMLTTPACNLHTFITLHDTKRSLTSFLHHTHTYYRFHICFIDSTRSEPCPSTLAPFPFPSCTSLHGRLDNHCCDQECRHSLKLQQGRVQNEFLLDTSNLFTCSESCYMACTSHFILLYCC